MSRRARPLRALAACVAAACVVAAALTACGGGSSKTATTSKAVAPSGTVVIYVSLPLDGPESTQSNAIIEGIKLELNQDHYTAGEFKVKYKILNDATSTADGWDPAPTARNALAAANNPKAIFFIGDLDSGASAISIPILNQAGVPQVSPASGYPGLTSATAGTHPGEPLKYYPSQVRTFFRLAPDDTVQAAADLLAFRQLGCREVAIADDGQLDGSDLATQLSDERTAYGITIARPIEVVSGPVDYARYALELKALHVRCFIYAGSATNPAIALTEAVHQALPAAEIFGSNQMCTSSWTAAVPPAMTSVMRCTAPAPGTGFFAHEFYEEFKESYPDGSNPDPLAMYGFEAMKLGLDTIASLGPEGNNKSDVLAALKAIKTRESALGTYGFTRDGDTTFRTYGLFRVLGGKPKYLGTLSPPHIG